MFTEEEKRILKIYKVEEGSNLAKHIKEDRDKYPTFLQAVAQTARWFQGGYDEDDNRDDEISEEDEAFLDAIAKRDEEKWIKAENERRKNK